MQWDPIEVNKGVTLLKRGGDTTHAVTFSWSPHQLEAAGEYEYCMYSESTSTLQMNRRDTYDEKSKFKVKF